MALARLGETRPVDGAMVKQAQVRTQRERLVETQFAQLAGLMRELEGTATLDEDDDDDMVALSNNLNHTIWRADRLVKRWNKRIKKAESI